MSLVKGEIVLLRNDMDPFAQYLESLLLWRKGEEKSRICRYIRRIFTLFF